MDTVTERNRWKDAARDALVSGTSASVASALMLTACSAIERGRPAAGINAPSQWVWGRREGYARRASLRHTAIGYAIHHATSIFWAVFYERAFGARRGPKSTARILAEAAAMSVGAFVVDYGLTPKRFQPGFEKHLSPPAMVAVYAAFALGLAATTLSRQKISAETAPD
jgi:hypothetical protein